MGAFDDLVPAESAQTRLGMFDDLVPDPNAEPDAPTWLGRRAQDIRGKKDKRYDGVGTVFDQFKGELRNPTANAATLGASDAQMSDIIRKQLGDRFIRSEKDANGYEVFVTRGQSGQEQRGYLNAPGIDSQDVSRGVYGALPYMLAGGAAGVATRGAGLLANMASQGVASAGTSVAGDLAQETMGSEQGVEAGKALATGLFGAAAPAVSKIASSAWQRFVAEPRYFNRASGTLTADGRAAAQQMGLDPATLTSDVAKRFARDYAANPDEAAKLIDSGKLEFNIPQTLGQRTKDSEQLMVEKTIRAGGYGTNAKERLIGLDQDQTGAVEAAARGTLPKQFLKEAGGRPLSRVWQQHTDSLPEVNLQKDQLGQFLQSTTQGAKTAAKEAETAAWDSTAPIFAKPEAAPLLKQSVQSRLGDLATVFDEVNTPVAYRMGQRMLSFIEGKAPRGDVQDGFGLGSNASIDTMRRAIGLMSKDAQTPTDKAASSALYQAYNDWMKKSADNGLLTGNLADLANFTRAIDISKQKNAIFNPIMNGRKTAGGKVLEKIMSTDTPEQVVETLFGSPQGGIKQGSIEAIRLMRQAVDKYGDRAAAVDVWSGLKVTHWSTLVQNKRGEMFTPGVMLNNIKSMMQNQRSLFNELYSPADRELINKFSRQLEGIAWKDPNPSGTATGLVSALKNLFGRFMNFLPSYVQAGVELTGVPRAYGTAVARKAVAQQQPAVRQSAPNFAPALSAFGANTDRYREH